MHVLADYFPLILFFVAFKLAGIYVATAVAIAASVVQIGYFHWVKGKATTIHWLSLAIIGIFGGATLWLHDDYYIKWKPTVLYWLFALTLLVGRVVFRRNLISALLKDFVLPDALWAKLTWGWVAFLFCMGLINLYVAFNFSLDTWVSFKVWGGIGLFMLAAIGTVASVARYLPEQS
jgi:intracellular septation protein